MLGTVEKVGQTLELFTRESPEWGVSQVAEALGVPKSSAHALLSTLAHIGLLHRMVTGRYRLGFKVLALSQTLLDTTPWRDVARREMAALVTEFGETVHLAALDGGHIIYVDKLQGTRAIQVSTTAIGNTIAPHGNALGKVMLASKPWEVVLSVVEKRSLHPFTPNTITSLDELQSELERVKARGFAYEVEECAPELCCVAAPIRNHNGEVISALGISVPAYRFHTNKDQYREHVIAAANTVSAAIGYDANLVAERGRLQWHLIDGREELKGAR